MEACRYANQSGKAKTPELNQSPLHLPPSSLVFNELIATFAPIEKNDKVI